MAVGVVAGGHRAGHEFPSGGSSGLWGNELVLGGIGSYHNVAFAMVGTFGQRNHGLAFYPFSSYEHRRGDRRCY